MSRLIRVLREPAGIYLLVGLAVGLAFALGNPPLRTPDEYNHFLRAYQVSRGRLVPSQQGRRLGGMVPDSLPELRRTLMSGELYEAEPAPEPRPAGFIGPMRQPSIGLILQTVHPPGRERPRLPRWKQARSLLQQPLWPERLEFQDFANTAVYAPVAYAPQALAFALGRWLGWSPLALLYAGRLALLGVLLLIGWWALRSVPIAGWSLLMLVAMPLWLSQSASLGADGATNALSLLWTALILRFALGAPREPTRLRLFGLALLAAALAVSKLAYLPLVGMVLIVPVGRLGGPRRRLGFLAGAATTALVSALGWAWIAHGVQIPYRDYDPDYRNGQTLCRGAVPDDQLRLVLRKPARFLSLTAATLWEERVQRRASFVASLEWLQVPALRWLIPAYLLALLAVALGQADGPAGLSMGQRGVILGALGLTLLSLTLFQYMNWTPVGAERIKGLTGRYFLPFGPPVAALLYNRRSTGFTRWVPLLALAAMGAALSAALWLLL